MDLGNIPYLRCVGGLEKQKNIHGSSLDRCVFGALEPVRCGYLDTSESRMDWDSYAGGFEGNKRCVGGR